jgi:hypothetical protein
MVCIEFIERFDQQSNNINNTTTTTTTAVPKTSTTKSSSTTFVQSPPLPLFAANPTRNYMHAISILSIPKLHARHQHIHPKITPPSTTKGSIKIPPSYQIHRHDNSGTA